MAKLSIPELQEVVATYVDRNKIASLTYTSSKDNVIGLSDKVGKIIQLDSAFYDKMPELDGDSLPLGKTIEEYFIDLILPVDFTGDPDGTECKKFYSPTARPVSYSYTLGRKKLPISIKNNDIERASLSAQDMANVVTTYSKRLSDSKGAYKYQIKRELLGVVAEKALKAYTDATAYVNATTDIVEGTFYKQGTPAVVAVCVKARTHTAGDTWASLITGGYLIVLALKTAIAKPVDTASGEAFIKKVKDIVEIAGDLNEGYSFNGNTIGPEQGLFLYMKQGIMSSLDVDTMAGAFNQEKLALPVTMKVIRDFGKENATIGTDKVYAIMVDPRGLKLHPDYDAIREDTNGHGDFVTMIEHLEFTAFLSRNIFIQIFVAP